jgi:transcriptional regulator with XRE-family HTH domain
MNEKRYHNFLPGKLYSHLGRMAFRVDRLREILTAKGILEPSEIHRKTGIPYPQLGRYLKDRGMEGSGLPSVDTLATIVIKLELDADYLLDSDQRYQNMPALRAAAHMSLDLYLAKRQEDDPLDIDDARTLRHFADQLERPPVWVADWARQYEAVVLQAQLRPEPRSPEALQTPRRRRLTS